MPPAPSTFPPKIRPETGTAPTSSPAARFKPAEIFSLFQAVTALTRPINIQPRALQTAPPDARELATGSAKSAQAIAYSATAVAEAAAALGNDEAHDVALAKILWEENLKQIERVQRLYNLGPLPFQTPPAP